MRSNIFVASALAIGAIATPLNKRFIVTEVDLEIVTKTVYVTPGAPAPTAENHGNGNPYHHRPGNGHKSSSSSSKVVYVPPPSSAPAPIETPTPTPTPEYTPPPAVTEAESSEAPASSAAPVTGSHKSGVVQATFQSGADYQAAVVYHHNAARANHNAPALVWDDEVAKNAKIAADTCNFTHYIPDGVANGQNIFTVSGDSFNVTAAITESWYKSELPPMLPYFGQNEIPESVFHSVGHLTAMVWKSTTKVGCASVDCSGRMVFPPNSPTEMDKFTVCNYAEDVPNMAGQYAANVLPPDNSNPTLNWTD